MTTMLDLVREAVALGASVHLAHLEPPLRGHYDYRSDRILVHIGLTMAEKKEVLAHELGHLRERDECSTGPNERRANRHAARLLIDLTDYVIAEAIDSDPQFIADELGITRHMVRVYQREWLPSLSLRRRV